MSFSIVIPSTYAFVLSVKITSFILNLELHDAFNVSSVTALALCFNFFNYSVTESMQEILTQVKLYAGIEFRHSSSQLEEHELISFGWGLMTYGATHFNSQLVMAVCVHL